MHARAALPAAILCSLALSLAASAVETVDEVGRRLLLGNTRADAEGAVEHYEARVAADPESYAARLGAARALNQLIAIRTNGNLPLFDGLQDTPAHRAIWADLGARALAHARVALAKEPQSIDAAAILATSYMFNAASQGILKSIVAGTASEFRANAQRVIDLDPRYDDAVGHTLMAGFYLVAPWPVGDMEQALTHYQTAERLAPDSVRIQYSLGVYWLREGEPAKARPHLERVVERPCSGNSERLLCDFMKREARRALASP